MAFASMPDDEEALEGIATHIRKLWEPRMRRALLESMDGGESGSSDIVVRSVTRFRTAM